jgi:hypothetical protein
MVGTKLLFYEETQCVCSAKTKFSRLGRVGDTLGNAGKEAIRRIRRVTQIRKAKGRSPQRTLRSALEGLLCPFTEDIVDKGY